MSSTNAPRPRLEGLHHVKLPVGDLDRSLQFYERVLGAERLEEADHRRSVDGALYAYILRVPGLGSFLELRLNPGQAARQRGFDPLTLAVRDLGALERWRKHLEGAGVRHSSVLVAIQAWVVVFEDPDGHRLRLYTLEKHGPEIRPDEDDPWLRSEGEAARSA